jgi:hypothetical protein
MLRLRINPSGATKAKLRHMRDCLTTATHDSRVSDKTNARSASACLSGRKAERQVSHHRKIMAIARANG